MKKKIYLLILLASFFICQSVADSFLAYGNTVVLDLTTQRGGVGQDKKDGMFILGETVKLRALVTSGGDPVQQILVGFEVRDPNNEISLIRSASTDENGYAIISFSIFPSSVNVGTWRATARASVPGFDVSDSLTFEVLAALPVGGYTLLFPNDQKSALRIDVYWTIVVAVVLLAAIINKKVFKAISNIDRLFNK